MASFASVSATNDDEDDWEKADLAPRAPPPTVSRFSVNAPVWKPSAPTLPAASSLTASPANDNDDDWDRGWNRNAVASGSGSSSGSSSRPGSTGAGWEENKRIWSAANTAPPLIYTQQAFPTLSNTNSSSSTPQLLARPSSQPPAPKITLLRRPAASNAPSPNGADAAGSATRRTLEEREEEYRLARERIFAASGGSSAGGASGGSKSRSPGPSGNGGGRGGRNGGSRSGSGSSTPTSSGQYASPMGNGGGGGRGGQQQQQQQYQQYQPQPYQPYQPQAQDQGVRRQPRGPPGEGAAGFGGGGGGGSWGRGG